MAPVEKKADLSSAPSTPSLVRSRDISENDGLFDFKMLNPATSLLDVVPRTASPPSKRPTARSGRIPRWAEPYSPMAVDDLRPDSPAPSLAGADGQAALTSMVDHTITQEGPVARVRLFRLLAQIWPDEIDRLGSCIDAALAELGAIVGSDGYLRARSSSIERVRVPTEDPATLRTVDEVPTAELGRAVHLLLLDEPRDRTGLIEAAAHLFGWRSDNQAVQAAVNTIIDHFVAGDHASESGGGTVAVDSV